MDISTVQRSLTCSALALIAATWFSACCRDRYRHELRIGSLSEVKETRIILYWNPDRLNEPLLMVANEAIDGSCLQLHGVRVVINGAVQFVHFVGGRSSGQTKGSFGPVDGTDSCDPLLVKVVVPNEPTRATDEIEVSDGTTTLRAEFPNVLTPVSFRQAPPSIVARGDVFHVSLQPPTTAGTGEYDAGNFVRASLNSTSASSALTIIPIRGISASDFEITIPKGTPPGATTLFLSSAQSAVPAKMCSASFCRAEQTFVLTSALTIR